ncbi:MAG: hypothetical protein AB1758_25930, partial [Candidatus Eremiobacterota bacterium]
EIRVKPSEAGPVGDYLTTVQLGGRNLGILLRVPAEPGANGSAVRPAAPSNGKSSALPSTHDADEAPVAFFTLDEVTSEAPPSGDSGGLATAAPVAPESAQPLPAHPEVPVAFVPLPVEDDALSPTLSRPAAAPVAFVSLDQGVAPVSEGGKPVDGSLRVPELLTRRRKIRPRRVTPYGEGRSSRWLLRAVVALFVCAAALTGWQLTRPLAPTGNLHVRFVLDTAGLDAKVKEQVGNGWPPGSLWVRMDSNRRTPRKIELKGGTEAILPRVPLGAGSIELAFSPEHPDYWSEAVPYDLTGHRPLVGDVPTQKLELKVRPAPRVTVLTQPGAHVHLKDSQDLQQTFEADDSGLCDLAGRVLPDRVYGISVTCEDFAEKILEPKRFTAGPSQTVDLRLERVAGTLDYSFVWKGHPGSRPTEWTSLELVLVSSGGREFPLKGERGTLAHVPLAGPLKVRGKSTRFLYPSVENPLSPEHPKEKVTIALKPAAEVVASAVPGDATVKILAAGGEPLASKTGECAVALTPGTKFKVVATMDGYVDRRTEFQTAEPTTGPVTLTLDPLPPPPPPEPDYGTGTGSTSSNGSGSGTSGTSSGSSGSSSGTTSGTVEPRPIEFHQP